MADFAFATLPTTLPKDARRIRGASRISIAPWIAAGANPVSTDIAYLGQIADGGVSLNLGREFQELEGEESYAPDGDVLTKEHTVVKATLMEAPIDVIAMLLGAPLSFAANAFQSADVKGQVVGLDTLLALGFGGMQTRPGKMPTRYYQVLVQTTNEDATPAVPTQWTEPSNRGYWQIFMARITLAGDMTFTKKNIVTLPIEINARWDWTVTPVTSSTPGAIDSVGYLWRRVNIYTTA